MPTPPKWIADAMAKERDLPSGLVGPAIDMSVPGALEAFMDEQDAMYEGVERESRKRRLAREKAARDAAE